MTVDGNVLVGAIVGLAALAGVLVKVTDLPRWIAVPLATSSVVVVLALASILLYNLLPPPLVEMLLKATPPPPSPDPNMSPHPVNFIVSPAISPLPDGSQETKLTSETRNYKMRDTNAHCSEPTEVTWRVDAREGWEIIVSSIRIAPTGDTGASVWQGTVDASAAGFTAKGRLVNSGQCVSVFGKTIVLDERGSLEVAGTYEEQQLPAEP